MRKLTVLLIIAILTMPLQSWSESNLEKQSTDMQKTTKSETPEPERVRRPGKLVAAASTMVAGGVLVGVGLNQIDKSKNNNTWSGVGREFVGQVFVGMGAASLITSAVYWILYARGEEVSSPTTTISVEQNGSRTMFTANFRF